MRSPSQARSTRFAHLGHLARRAPVSLAMLALLSGLGASPSALSALPPAPMTADASAPRPAQLADALGQFQRAASGQTAAIAPALAAWQALLAADAGNLSARAYVGALTAMQANTTLLPWRKMGFADDGLALLDKALAQLTPEHDQQLFDSVPVSLQVRLVAAGTFAALPAMFNRAERAGKLIDGLLKHPLLGQAPTGFQVAVWLQAGKLAARNQRQQDARQWLGRVVASGLPQAAEAQALLKGL